ncbi:type 1 fimbriae major subunit FimA [Klebsiella pneumoniae]|nr:type 1 fimbriae major subunit FimA [Klebsiella pneumoniae]
MKIKTLAMIVVSALSLSSTAALADTTTVNGGTVHFKGEVKCLIGWAKTVQSRHPPHRPH